MFVPEVDCRGNIPPEPSLRRRFSRIDCWANGYGGRRRPATSGLLQYQDDDDESQQRNQDEPLPFVAATLARRRGVLALGFLRCLLGTETGRPRWWRRKITHCLLSLNVLRKSGSALSFSVNDRCRGSVPRCGSGATEITAPDHDERNQTHDCPQNQRRRGARPIDREATEQRPRRDGTVERQDI